MARAHWFRRAAIAVASASVVGLLAMWQLSRYEYAPEPVVFFLLVVAVLILPSVTALLVFNGLPVVLIHYRFLRNRCQCCGYDLTGNVSGVCPECGKKVKPPGEELEPP